MRLALIVPLKFLLLPFVLLAEDAEPVCAVVEWPGGLESPSVCVEKPTWFVSVAPAKVGVGPIPKAVLRVDDVSTEARVLHFDVDQRLCLLETSTPFEGILPSTLSEDPAPKAGERASCLTGEESCLSTVAGKEWSYQGARFSLPLLRLRISNEGLPCTSGTPMVDEERRVMGLLTCLKPTPVGEAYAIPAARIRKMVEDVKRHKRSGRVWIGLVLHDASSTPEVLDIKSGSPAEVAGLRPGDVVIGVNDVEITSFDDLDEAVQNLPAGAQASVEVLRGLDHETLTVVPRFAELSAAAAR